MLRIFDVRSKEVINIINGERLGYISDFEVDIDTGTLTGILMPGTVKGLGLFSKSNDILIDWNKIVKIGADTILVNLGHD